MRTSLMVLATLLAGTAQAQTQQSGSGDSGAQPELGNGYPTWDAARVGHYRRTLQAVRKEALQLQAADGGRLTPEHLVYLRARIDAADRSLAYNLGRRDGSMFAHPALR